METSRTHMIINPMMTDTPPGRTAHKQTAQLGLLCLALALFTTSDAQAGPREQAKQIHDRIAGIPPDADTLNNVSSE